MLKILFLWHSFLFYVFQVALEKTIATLQAVIKKTLAYAKRELSFSYTLLSSTSIWSTI